VSHIFREYGIGNLLEGDFFSWYCSEQQWTDDISDKVKEIFEILSLYEDKAVFDTEDNVIDLFKELFMHIIPDKVRHSLGEYYTPMWLADNVVSEAIAKNAKNNWRAIDPCAGSGTFVVSLIKKVLGETSGQSDKERLSAILSRVSGIDLNPLAVLTTRINYFYNIAPLISDEDYIEIPVYLGDSSYIPKRINIDGTTCLSYTLSTLKGEFNINLPESIVHNNEFSQTMFMVEALIQANDVNGIVNLLQSLLPVSENNRSNKQLIKNLAIQLISFEQQNWNGIWARIICNYLTTACLGKFDIVVGNPPWIDWKSLPNRYRDRVKGLCIDHHLFSGDGITGGINLNICALITNVVGSKYLSDNGILGFLMPKSILFQQSYEGFRNCYLENGERLYIQEVSDWSYSGHPFSPVQEPFLTYFFSHTIQNYKNGINAYCYIKKKSIKAKISSFNSLTDFSSIKDKFILRKRIIGQVHPSSTAFTYADDKDSLLMFEKIAGYSTYTGREGIEFYPQELLLFTEDKDLPPTNKGLALKNFQNKKSKYRIPQRTIILEKDYLRPMIKGVDIERFSLTPPTFIVPFPYDNNNTRLPIPIAKLKKKSPRLSKYYIENKKIFDSQTSYNDKIIGQGEKAFYSLARVGDYSFGKYFVCFRDNSKWQACVVSAIDTKWGEKRYPCFQNHAASISQDDNDNFITKDEAHYICAILNSRLVTNFINSTSDSRTFKIRPQVYIPKFDFTNPDHLLLSKLSKQAHKYHNNQSNLNYSHIAQKKE